MPESYEEYFSDEGLDKAVEMLNSFADPYCRWHKTRSRKEHEDLFGDHIGEGGWYYKREGAGFYDTIKLYRLSMAKVCFLLRETTPYFAYIAQVLLKREEKHRAKEFRKFNVYWSRIAADAPATRKK